MGSKRTTPQKIEETRTGELCRANGADRHPMSSVTRLAPNLGNATGLPPG